MVIKVYVLLNYYQSESFSMGNDYTFY